MRGRRPRRYAGVRHESLARRIVKALGAGAIEVIRQTPERLAEVKGLTRAVREKLVATVEAEYSHHKLQAFLRGIGLGPRTLRSDTAIVSLLAIVHETPMVTPPEMTTPCSIVEVPPTRQPSPIRLLMPMAVP